MTYFQTLKENVARLCDWADLRHEQGQEIASEIDGLVEQVKAMAARYERIGPVPAVARREPAKFEEILAARIAGPRRLSERFDASEYSRRVEGAWLARAAGNTLGAVVEGWSIQQMEEVAEYHGDQFPPRDYWTAPGRATHALRYGTSRRVDYTKKAMSHIPADDDLTYTLLGLLVLEEYGPEFTTKQLGEAWLKYLPRACMSEEVTLENLRTGVSWEQAGEQNNRWAESLGADIRADPWGYAAAGWPERAAAMAYRDARLSHRNNGIYGAMYFAASISAAFAVDDPLEACRIGLTEIPKESRLYHDLIWAFDRAEGLKDFRHARQLVDERFAGMSIVHTNNNACLTIFGLALGGKDVTEVIGQTVAMGMDNDCTAGTAGSIVGAVVGVDNVPEHWYRPFADKARTYINGHEWFSNADIARRFTEMARNIYQD